jgi:hypothetical protein
MTQADQPADGKSEVRPLASKDDKLENRIADEKNENLMQKESAEERRIDSSGRG